MCNQHATIGTQVSCCHARAALAAECSTRVEGESYINLLNIWMCIRSDFVTLEVRPTAAASATPATTATTATETPPTKTHSWTTTCLRRASVTATRVNLY